MNRAHTKIGDKMVSVVQYRGMYVLKLMRWYSQTGHLNREEDECAHFPSS